MLGSPDRGARPRRSRCALGQSRAALRSLRFPHLEEPGVSQQETRQGESSALRPPPLTAGSFPFPVPPPRRGLRGPDASPPETGAETGDRAPTRRRRRRAEASPVPRAPEHCEPLSLPCSLLRMVFPKAHCGGAGKERGAGQSWSRLRQDAGAAQPGLQTGCPQPAPAAHTRPRDPSTSRVSHQTLNRRGEGWGAARPPPRLAPRGLTCGSRPRPHPPVQCPSVQTRHTTRATSEWKIHPTTHEEGP